MNAKKIVYIPLGAWLLMNAFIVMEGSSYSLNIFRGFVQNASTLSANGSIIFHMSWLLLICIATIFADRKIARDFLFCLLLVPLFFVIDKFVFLFKASPSKSTFFLSSDLWLVLFVGAGIVFFLERLASNNHHIAKVILAMILISLLMEYRWTNSYAF